MRLFSDETRRNRQALIEARQHLTDATDAVIQAEKPLMWWQRLDIDAGLHTRQSSGQDGDEA